LLKALDQKGSVRSMKLMSEPAKYIGKTYEAMKTAVQTSWDVLIKASNAV